MKQRDTQNLPLFEDAYINGEEKILQLNEGDLVTLFEQWKTINLLSSLRRAILDFKHEIQNDHYSTRSNGSDSSSHVQFSQIHLFNELD